jgi:hypothetical protein
MPATHAATHAVSIGRRYGHPQQSDAWKPPATHAAWLDGHLWKTSCGRTIHVDDVARGGEKSALADGAKPTCLACRKLRSARTWSA